MPKSQMIKKPKMIRGPLALLQTLRNSAEEKIAKFLREKAPNLMNEPSSAKGRKPNPVNGILRAEMVKLIKRVISDNQLSDEITNNNKFFKECELIKTNKAKNKNVHNALFSRFRGKKVGIKDFEKLIDNLTLLGLRQNPNKGKFLMMDSIALDICAFCSLSKKCSYIHNKDCHKTPTNCPGWNFENAGCAYKKKDKKFMGYKVHFVIDLIDGDILTIIITPANVADNRMGLPLMKKLTKLGVHPEFVLADASYDDIKIYDYIVNQMKAKAFINLNKRNSKGEWLYVEFKENDSVLKLRMSQDGIPICVQKQRMLFGGVDEKTDNVAWICSNPSCLHNTCPRILLLNPKMQSRYCSLPPRSSKLWNAIYSFRKWGEQPFSLFENTIQIFGPFFRRFSSIKINVFMGVIVLKLMHILSHKLGLRAYYRSGDLHHIKQVVNGDNNKDTVYYTYPMKYRERNPIVLLMRYAHYLIYHSSYMKPGPPSFYGGGIA